MVIVTQQTVLVVLPICITGHHRHTTQRRQSLSFFQRLLHLERRQCILHAPVVAITNAALLGATLRTTVITNVVTRALPPTPRGTRRLIQTRSTVGRIAPPHSQPS